MKRIRPVYLAAMAAVTLGVCARAAAPPAIALGSASRRATASTTGVISLTDSAQMKMVSKRGSVLSERGEATGSVPFAPITCIFTGINAARGTATLTGYSHGSSLIGRAAISAYAAGHITHFEGLMTITGGTGVYAHASGQGLRFKGTIDRHDFHASAEISGTFHR